MVEVVLVTDKNYIKFAVTTIHSTLKNTTKRISIKCIVTDVSEDEISFYSKKFSDNVKFIRFENNRIKNIIPKNHVSQAAYVKIFLPEILRNIDKVILLDSDLLVKENIEELWMKFDEKYTIQAVWSPNYDYDNEIIGLESEEKTFNSGVMLMNLKKMRENGDVEKMLKFMDEKNHLTKLNEQAIFNAIYANQWGNISLNWNVQYSFYFDESSYLNLTIPEKIKLLEHPSIIHFTSHNKPWLFRNAHPYKREYKKTFMEINGRVHYDDLNFKSILQRLRDSFRIKKYRKK